LAKRGALLMFMPLGGCGDPEREDRQTFSDFLRQRDDPTVAYGFGWRITGETL
jgi:hypothetical protein